MKYLKELLKEKKYVPVIIAVLVVTEAFLFTFYGYHWLKTVRYLILSAFLVVLGFIDSKRTLIPKIYQFCCNPEACLILEEQILQIHRYI